MSEINRRKFLLILGALFGGLGIHRSKFLNKQKDFPPFSNNGKKLIIIHLVGGNDGLFTLMPKNNEIINANRKGLIKKLNKGIHWNNNLILNEKLKDFFDLAQRGWLSIIPNVGHQNPTFSHFLSTDIWATGVIPKDKVIKTGWVGRLIDENKHTIKNFDELLSFENDSLIFRGKKDKGIIWSENSFFRKKVKHIVDQELFNLNNYEFLQNELKKTYKINQLLESVEPSIGYPKTKLGNDLATVSSIIGDSKPFKVFHLNHIGYDTHQWQTHQLNELYDDLGKCVKTFVHDLNNMGELNNTQILIYSEFGRSIGENSNGGTDHGSAGPVFVLGGRKIYNELGNLKPNYNISNHYGFPVLQHQVDFRDIFTTVQNNWLT